MTTYAKRKLKYSRNEHFNLLHYVEWDRFVTLAESKSGLRVTLSYLRFCLIGKPRHVAFFSQSFFIFYEFMMMPMIIFCRYYSIYVILHLAAANYCQ